MSRPKVPTNVLRSVIAERGTAFDVTRADTQTVSNIGGVEETTSTHTVDLYITEESRQRTQEPHGETYVQVVNALALPTADLADGDQITYDGNDWELTVRHVPNVDDTQYLDVTAQRADTT